MVKHLFLIKTEEPKKLSYFLSSAVWKKDDYLSDADADPRIMISSILVKLGLGNN